MRCSQPGVSGLSIKNNIKNNIKYKYMDIKKGNISLRAITHLAFAWHLFFLKIIRVDYADA